MRLFATCLLSLPLLVGCVSHTRLAPEARLRIERELLAGERVQYLRESLYVTPFFGDGTKRLLTPVPPQDVRLLEDLSGQPINPGPVEAAVPAGSTVRVRKLEFPTAFTVAERVLVTPRTQPWVFLEVEGVPGEKPLVLVLPDDADSEAEFLANVERHLTTRDLAAQLSSLPPPVREAVRAKRAVAGMSAEALRMSWGLPARIQVDYRESVRVETWTFPGERRRAVLEDGRVTEVTDPA